jgi:putative hydrolase of the HAD superfamily
MTAPVITTLFLDVGGVLLTNGWDEGIRKRTAEAFALDFTEMNHRHHLTYDTYEAGKLSLDAYLKRVVFYAPRSFSVEEFKTFMYAQSQPYLKMIAFVRELKLRYRLKIAVVSNEGRELTVYRIQTFKLAEFVDFFITSCFVHFRKPDEDIYRMALDIAQVQPPQMVYVDDRAMFVEVAQGLGLRGIHHTGYETTRVELEKLGLSLS